jgi:hypothetical protein
LAICHLRCFETLAIVFIKESVTDGFRLPSSRVAVNKSRTAYCVHRAWSVQRRRRQDAKHSEID